jgi:hypothetical protein
MRLEVFIDTYVVQETIRCLPRKKLAISIPRTQTSLLHNFLSVTCNKSISEFIDTCKRRMNHLLKLSSIELEV